MNTREKLVEVQVYIPRSQELYDKLFAQKEKIESQITERLIWMPLEGKTASRIKAIHAAADLQDENAWPTYFKWLKQTAKEFAGVFGKYV